MKPCPTLRRLRRAPAAARPSWPHAPLLFGQLRAVASRKRRRDVFWSSPQGEAVLAALPEIALEQPQMGDVDEVALTVLWAWGVVGRMACHAGEAHPKVACRCELLGTALAAVLEETSPRSSAWVGVPTPRLRARRPGTSTWRTEALRE